MSLANSNNDLSLDDEDVNQVNNYLADNNQHNEQQDNSSNSSQELNYYSHGNTPTLINNIEVSFSQNSSFLSNHSPNSNPDPNSNTISESNPAGKSSLQETSTHGQSYLADLTRLQTQLPSGYFCYIKNKKFVLKVPSEVHMIVVERDGEIMDVSLDTKPHSVFLECEKELIVQYFNNLSDHYPDKKKTARKVYEILYVERTDKDSPIDNMREEVENKKRAKVEKNKDPEPYIRTEKKVLDYIYNQTRKK